MADVARCAGVSPKTVYRLIPTKAELLRIAVSERIGRFLLEVDAAALDALPIREGLERLLIAYCTLTLSREAIAMYRLVLRKCDRFPELAVTFSEVAIQRTNQVMADWLSRQCECGLIELEDPQMAIQMLRGMMVMDPQRAVMLGQRTPPDQSEIAARARQCARLFLNGCLVR